VKKNNWLVWCGFACVQLATTSGVAAQYYYYNNKFYAGSTILNAGISAGVMNCFTDLGGHKGAGKEFLKDLNWRCSKPCVSIYIDALYKDAIALRLQAALGGVFAADSVLRKSDPAFNGRYGRNLSFKSRIGEIQLAFEIHPLFFKLYADDEAPYWSPYLVGGIGVFHFNPKASLDGRWYDLRPLRLEGQGIPGYSSSYRLTQISLPLGIGIKYETSPFTHLRLELVHRVLFTDYLDDVSTNYIDPLLFEGFLSPAQAAIANKLFNRMGELQPGFTVPAGTPRGNIRNNDSFFSIELKMGFVLRAGRAR
jgi:hypothetical protein